ncbi:Unknown protein sequence [Pseudomonas amygdali pv. sesami]|nr:hypothetical protein [Pseudomonas syringae]KPB17058.1 Unknown protein sequence [Pseudomonas amygdali pv. sesami]
MNAGAVIPRPAIAGVMPFGSCLAVMGWISLMSGHFVREVATTLLN